jgi:hypothetical protein
MNRFEWVEGGWVAQVEVAGMVKEPVQEAHAGEEGRTCPLKPCSREKSDQEEQ